MGKRTVAIILAGGAGKRMGADIPKQFLELAGKPIIIHTLEKFDRSADVSDIVIVCHKSGIERLKDLIKKNNIEKVFKIVPGGTTRQESSFIGVKNCPPGTSLVLIHDAVRPFVDERIIKDVAAAAQEEGAAGAVIDEDDTVVVERDSYVLEVPDRSVLKKIQTPQGFRYDLIFAAHEKALENKSACFTDDCSLVIAMGEPVKLVEGAARNIKITDKEDLFLAEMLMPVEK
ncbi:MAG: 2-C-methyl-D-erythritol 4-phosphate cytidylyltransferase [Candidatus Omnitrophota bacterium]